MLIFITTLLFVFIVKASAFHRGNVIYFISWHNNCNTNNLYVCGRAIVNDINTPNGSLE